MRIRSRSGLLAVAAVAAFSVLLFRSMSCTPSKDAVRPNIVLILIDALRPDHLSCYGYQRPTSPEIDELARGGILFETAIAPAPWTKTSFSSFLTSLYPFQHGVVGWQAIMPETVVTLPEILREHGYSTMAIVNMLGITGRFEVLKGIDEVSAAAKYKREAPQTTADAIGLMENSAQPFFIMIHYFDPHWPYRPPVRYLDLVRAETDVDPLVYSGVQQESSYEKPSEERIARQIVLYDACVRYADEGVGEIVDFLEESGIRQETAIIVTADHGEAFWEHGVGSHGHSVYDEEIRVPLILNYPDRYRQARRIDAQVSLIDLLPTIVDLTGAKDDGHREGRNLNELIEKGSVKRSPGSFLPDGLDLCESTLNKAPDTKGIRSGDWKIIIEPATSLVELYNLTDDPGETVNLWGRGGAVGDSLLRLIQRVPGSSVSGWRLGFTGDGTRTAFKAEVRVGKGGRLTRVDRLVAGGELLVEVSDDSTSLSAEGAPRGQQILLFGTEPLDGEVRFKITAQGEDIPEFVYTGAGKKPLGETFVLKAGQATDLPDAFVEFRRSGSPGAHIWWLPGGNTARAAKTTRLTPEEKKRLKALGYIQ